MTRRKVTLQRLKIQWTPSFGTKNIINNIGLKICRENDPYFLFVYTNMKLWIRLKWYTLQVNTTSWQYVLSWSLICMRTGTASQALNFNLSRQVRFPLMHSESSKTASNHCWHQCWDQCQWPVPFILSLRDISGGILRLVSSCQESSTHTPPERERGTSPASNIDNIQTLKKFSNNTNICQTG